jgi:hypothetical protein
MYRRTFVASSVALIGSLAGCTFGQSTKHGDETISSPDAGEEHTTEDKQITVITEEESPVEESFIQANLVENENRISENQTIYRYSDPKVQSLKEVQSAVREAVTNPDTFGGGAITSSEQMERVDQIHYVRYRDRIVRVGIAQLD